ncbi:hypothetical protein QCM77_10945 [Bradyrhizobium sp. SSUT18]|uniref:hypothetical protein n=1 Tax=Bradyrhizobium sp. SSUT18 TaxID=3040602 RepID=UPI00244B7896|nr:hypothetical protein [Bradyrhizobium sp. SSUT18]MDH2400450.1 hypothetical protein [Bradyrhizobium sp. SSUT18]
MTYVKQMQRIVDEYRLEGLPWPTSAKNIADWAISTSRWELPAAAIRRRCADDIASAMREEYMTDRKGRRVRLLHPAPLETVGQTEMIWDDIRTAPRDHMLMSFQHRRRGIVGDCRQMKTDVDSYNDAHPEAEAIQIVFDFTMDLAELEAAEDAA